MPYFFSLSAECGATRSAAELLAQHFQGFTVSVNGTTLSCDAGTAEYSGAWWAGVYPEGVTQSGIRHAQDTRDLTHIALQMYEKLRTAPPYRFAMVGIEVFGYPTIDELDDRVVILDFNGFVLAEYLWERLGSPDVFVPFAPGYRWRPLVQVE
jgi:hypothetical protein